MKLLRKNIMLKKLLLITLVVFVVVVGCKKEEEQRIEDKKLGLIEDDLSGVEVTTLNSKPTEISSAPGTSANVERAFENAPPIIPHSNEGFLPITLKNNLCLTCHLPAQAKNIEGSTPMSNAHFTEYRPETPVSHGKVETFMIELQTLDPARYNCMLCHVTQTDVTVDIKNLFTPDFRKEADKTQSNLNEVFREGI